jgi:hypothetical protein
MPISEIQSSYTDEQRRLLAQFKDEPRRNDDPVLSKYLTGNMLVALTSSGSFTLKQAWAIVRPSSRSTGVQARAQAHRFIKHHLPKHPLGINESLEASGITIKGMTDMCAEAKQVTK